VFAAANASTIWNVNRASEPGLGANECVLLLEDVAQVHGIPPFSARVVQSRTVRLIHGVALDECHGVRSVTGRAHHIVPIAQCTEQMRPKHRVAGESPAGDTISGA